MRQIDLRNVQGATSETAREINRRIILNLIRGRQPVSRADIARISGLQRSTVSLIIEQLIDADWVREGATGRLPRGRRPTYISLNDQRAIVAVDLQPSTTTIALSDINAQILAQETVRTPHRAANAIDTIAARIDNLLTSRPEFTIDGIGVSVPGRVDSTARRIVFAPNLKWRDVDLATPLSEAAGLPVVLENAANACALAEVWYARSQVRDLVVVTVSEGLGVGMFLNGQLVRGPAGTAGEFGHVAIDLDGPLCTCGNRGCWEVFASNLAALRYYDGAGITFDELLSLAARNDTRATRALERMATYLGIGAAHLVNGLSPAYLVFTGEFTRAWPRLGPIIESEINRRAVTPGVTKVIPAEPDSRLRGAIALVLQKHFGAPSIL